MSWPWSELGLPGPSDLSAVRHAYAQRLKTTHPEEDPEGFQRLHSAFQTASRLARRQQQSAPPPPVWRQEERGRQKNREQRWEEQAEPPPEWDYDALLREGQTGRSGSQREEQAEPPPEWDYDELLQEGQTARSGPQREEQAEPPPEWDYDELLQEGQTARSGPQREERQDWDYERLFAEGDAERAQARRRRGEERSRQDRERRSAYERERLESFSRQQARWRETEALLHTLELLYSSGAPTEEWNKLFQGSMFQQAKDSLDLIFGLEDFLSVHQDLPQPVRLALFAAYGFDRGVSRPELRPLYQMLLPARQEENKKRHRQWGLNLLGFFGGLAGLMICMVVLTSSLLPIYLILAGVIFYGLRKGWLQRPPKHLEQGRRSWIWVPVLALVSLALVLAVPWLTGRLTPPDPRELVCQYLEEDFGQSFQSLYSGDAGDAERYSNVFQDASSRRFLAGPDGERDLEAGRRGYTTNYTDIRLMWSLRQFTQNQSADVTLTMDVGQGLENWETTGRYILCIPFSGAQEVIRQLGIWLEETARADWYQTMPPFFQLTLACPGMAEDEYLVISDYCSDNGPFDPQPALAYYEEELPFHYCAALLEACGIRETVRGSGTAIKNLSAQGRMELDGQSWYWLAGLDGENNVVIQYFVSPSGGVIRCFPDALIHTEEEILSLPFYKIVHLPQNEGIRFRFVDVFYAWTR